MNLRDLEYVQAIALHKNFSRAAEACNVSQPALSSQIKKLELELGIDIFIRDVNRIELSDFGKQIIGYANQITEQATKIRETAIQFKDTENYPLKLGMTPTLAPYLIKYFRDILANLYPDMRVVLVEDKPVELAKMVEKREIDVALLARKSHEKICVDLRKVELDFSSLWLEPLFLGVSKENPLAKLDFISAQDVPADKLIRFNIPFGYELEKDLPETGNKGDSTNDYDVSGARFETVCRHVCYSDNCTIINAIAAEQFKRDNWELAFLKFSDEGNLRDLGIVSRAGHPRERLLKRIIETVQASPPEGSLPISR